MAGATNFILFSLELKLP